eukprot:g15847.t1
MTEFNRRNILAAAGFAIAAATTPFAASAQSGDPIHLIVPYGGGGLIDGLVRQIGDMMSAELDQPVVVENKPGSNGIIGATYAAAAKPDGLTYFIGATGPLSLNVLLRSNLTYDLDSFVPVGTMMSGPLTDKLGVPMVDVAYRNNPSAIVDLIGGQNDLNFSTPISLVKHEEAGDLKMLAISTEERHERFPDLPTTVELGYPDLVSSFWFGVLAPAGTPEDQIARVSAALQNAMKNEELQTKMTNVGMTPHVGGPDAMQAQLDWDQEFWGGVIKENNITLE